MSISNIEMQDENGNIYYPKTIANDVFFEDGTTIQQKLNDGELKGTSNIIDGKTTGSVKFKDIVEDNTHVLGEYSSTFGLNNTAYGDYSHVEGHKNMSFDTYGHCEGFNTYNLRGGYHVNKSVIGDDTTILYLDMYNDDFILDNWIKSNKVSIILTFENNQSVITDSKFIIANVVKFDRSTHTIEIENLDISNFDFYMVTHDITNLEDASNRSYAGHSEGHSNITIGSTNHAEGSKNIISGANSHIEGSNNIGEGSNNHIEGTLNFGTGAFSHIEGIDNHDFGRCNHIEGNGNLAYGNNSHAGGLCTISSSGNDIFSVKIVTGSAIVKIVNMTFYGNTDNLKLNKTVLFVNQNSPNIAETRKIIRIGTIHPHAILPSTTGENIEIEVDKPITLSYSSMLMIVETDDKKINGVNTHLYSSRSTGYLTVASGAGSYCGGNTCFSNGLNSFAHGYMSMASGDNSVAIGSRNNSLGMSTMSFGYNNNAIGYSSIAIGNYNDIYSPYGIAIGKGNYILSSYATTTGRDNSIIDDGWFILQSNTENADGTRTLRYTYSSQTRTKLEIGKYIYFNGTRGYKIISFDNTAKTFTIEDGYAGQPDFVFYTTYAYLYPDEFNTTYSEDPGCGFVSGNKSYLLANEGAVFGHANTVCGDRTLSSGTYNRSYGGDSAIIGAHLIGYDNCQLMAGTFNIEKEYLKRSTEQKDMFVIGNGSAWSNRSNAFRVTGAGATYGMSAFNSTGADYAEFFEWVDGNPNNEDRVGHFVTFSDDKIKIANQNDDYILGVISGNPSVIGNSHNDMWNEMYVRDEFDRIVYEDVEVPDTFKTIHHDAVYENQQNTNPLDIDTNKKSNILISEAYDEEVLDKPKHMEHRMKINPLYDQNKEYIPRERRPEWSAVGMFGVLSVYDDGTCTVNGYAKVSNNGIATKSDSGYRVLKRVTGNIIKILFRS